MPCGLCKFGRFRPLADLGLITCILNELGCQVELSPAVLTTVLRSGGAKFTGASMAIASQDPSQLSSIRLRCLAATSWV